jgi:hypothetical protein
MKILKHDFGNGTPKYSQNLQKHMTHFKFMKRKHAQSLQMQLLSITDSTTEKFFSRFTQFRSFEGTAEFIKYAANLT